MEHQINVSEPWYTLLKSGIKTIEGRLCTSKYSLIRPYDIIVFHRKEDNYYRLPPETFKAMVVSTKVYTKEDAMGYTEERKAKNIVENFIENESAEDTVPGQTIYQAIETYRSFWTWESIYEFGMIAIRVKVVDNNDS